MRIIIDPGHSGPAEPGAVGPSGLTEAAVNLAVAKIVVQLLDGHDVSLTRDDDITDTDLSWRPALANDADVFISIHCNAFVGQNDDGSENRSARGSETWIGTNASNRSKDLAQLAVDELSKVTGCNRGVKVANFTVIQQAACPAILAELEFISNPIGEISLRHEQLRYATALATAVLKWEQA